MDMLQICQQLTVHVLIISAAVRTAGWTRWRGPTETLWPWPQSSVSRPWAAAPTWNWTQVHFCHKCILQYLCWLQDPDSPDDAAGGTAGVVEVCALSRTSICYHANMFLSVIKWNTQRFSLCERLIESDLVWFSLFRPQQVFKMFQHKDWKQSRQLNNEHVCCKSRFSFMCQHQRAVMNPLLCAEKQNEFKPLISTQ